MLDILRRKNWGPVNGSGTMVFCKMLDRLHPLHQGLPPCWGCMVFTSTVHTIELYAFQLYVVYRPTLLQLYNIVTRVQWFQAYAESTLQKCAVCSEPDWQ